MRRDRDESRRLGAAMAALGQSRDPDAGLRCLLSQAGAVRREATSGRRRIEMIERAAREHGLPPAFAAKVYDIAVEENLEPAFGIALVACGVAVCEAEPPPDAAHEELPDWLVSPQAAGASERERRLRASFRRLRGLLERHDSAESALRAFVDEPDVVDCGY